MKSILTIAIILIASAVSSFAQSGLFGSSAWGEVTLSDTNVAGSATETITSDPIPVNGATGVAVMPEFAIVGAGTGNVVFSFAVSLDGSTWSTTTPYTLTVAGNGTNTVRGFGNAGASGTVANANYIRLATIQNANTGVVHQVKIAYGKSN